MSLYNGNADTSIISLSKQISQLSCQLSACTTGGTHPESSFGASSAIVLATPEYEDLRAQLNDAALDLLRLVNGPKNTLRTLCFSHYDLSALQIAVERGFFDHVPLAVDISGLGSDNQEQESINIADIAIKAGIDEDRAGRVLRLLATHRIFEEIGSGSGKFKHTAMSALLARDKDFHALVHMQ